MLNIIQGEKQTVIIDLVSSKTGKRTDLTGNTEIKVCYVAGTTVVEKTKTATQVTVIGDEEDGQIQADLQVADTDSMPPTSEGHIEISIDYGSGDIRKSQILNAFSVASKLC